MRDTLADSNVALPSNERLLAGPGVKQIMLWQSRTLKDAPAPQAVAAGLLIHGAVTEELVFRVNVAATV